MGDVLSNMYLKTQAPLLPENTALSNVTVTFPGEICETVAPGESLTIQDSELRQIKLSETTLLPYTGSGTVYNDTINRTFGSNVMSNAAIGFIEVNTAVLGTKLIDQEVVISDDPTPSFQVRANISTYQVVTSSATSIDGGLRNFELYNLNRSSKKDLLFGISQTGTDTQDGALIELTELPLFTMGSDTYKLNMKGRGFVLDTTFTVRCNQTVGGWAYSPVQPLMITVAPEYGSKFIFSNVNVVGTDGGSASQYIQFSTNVSQNNYLTVATAGTGYSADTYYATTGTGAGATVLTSPAITSPLTADNVFLESHGYGYKEGDVLTVVGGSGQVNWAVGDRNKSPLTQNDSLAHISIDGDQFPLASAAAVCPCTLAQVGKDFIVKYYDDGDFIQNPMGSSNVISSILGYNFKQIKLSLSKDFYFYVSDESLFCNRTNLLFSIDYGSSSTATKLFSNVAATLDQTAPTANKLNFYANVANAQDVQILTSETTYTTPAGSQFSNLYVQGISATSDDYRLDGSINPYFSMEGPEGHTRITIGASQVGTVNSMAYNIQISQNLPGSSAVAIARSYDFKPFKEYNAAVPGGTWPAAGAPWPAGATTYNGMFSVCHGGIQNDSTTFPDQLITSLVNWEGNSNLFMTSNVDGINTTSTQSIQYDADLMNAIRYGGLKIRLMNIQIIESLTVSVAYPKLDIYAGTGTESLVDVLQFTNDTLTLDFGGNDLDSKTVTITNGSNVVAVNLKTSALSLTDADCAKIIVGNCSYITPQNVITPSWGGGASNAFVNSGMGTDNQCNVLVTATTYDSTVFTKTSNGYVNLLTTVGQEGPIPTNNKQLDIAFFSNTAGAYSNVVSIVNEYISITLPEANVTAQTLEDITDPHNATIEFKNGTVGNIFTYVTNNFVEYNWIKGGTTSNITIINTLQFEKPGYDILFDLDWQLAHLGNTVSVMSHMGTYDNRTTTRHSNVLPASSDFIKANVVTLSNPSNKNYVQAYTANAYETYITSSNKTYPNTNAYPFSMLSITMSTAQRLPISYNTSNAWSNRISLLPPTDLTMGTGNLNAWFNSDYSIYSGPTSFTINTDSIKSIMNNTSYSTNVAYTRGRLTANISGTGPTYGNVSTTFPTYSTNANIEFTTFANTMTIGTNTFSISDTVGEGYDRFLRSNTLLYNSKIDLGDTGVVTDANVTIGKSQASFTYNTGGTGLFNGSDIYFLGKNYDTTTNATAECYKVSTVTNITGSPLVTQLIDFDFAFYGGGACLDTDNFDVYLFAPNDGNSLYKIKFQTTERIFQGAWSLVSTSFPWNSVQSAGISYYNQRLYSITGYIDNYGSTSAYNHINYFDISTGLWGVINTSYGMSRTIAPQLEAGGNIYFGGYKTDGAAAAVDQVDTWYKFSPTTSTVVQMTTTDIAPTVYHSAMTTYGNPTSSLYIAAFKDMGSRILIIDMASDTVSNVAVQASPIKPNSVVNVSSISGASLASDYLNSVMVMYGGYDDILSDLTANVYTMDMGLVIPLVYNTLKLMDIQRNDGFINASFVGPVGPGVLPIVKSGIRIAQERVPIFTIADSSNTDKFLEFGLNRSNVVTAVQRSSRTNKGIFENWYIDTKTSTNLVINTGWEGTDSSNNYSQDTLGALVNLSISSSLVTSATSVTITHAAARFAVSSEPIVITGHTGTAQDLALNQTYTVAGVVGLTKTVLTGAGLLRPALTLQFTKVVATSTTAGTVTNTTNTNRPIEVGESFVVTGWTNALLDGTYTVTGGITATGFTFTNTTTMTGTPTETATYSQVITNGIYTTGTVVANASAFAAGPVWAGDAVNTNDAIANFYSSNIIFQSTTNAATDFITFETSTSAGANPRDNLVPNSVANSHVDYTTMPLMANNFFNFSVDGVVPYTSSNNSSVTISNKFNPFVKSTFENFPSITACYDTDNIPTLDWEFNYLATQNAIAPPYANVVSNVMVNDVYRQYLPSKITRAGRLDKVSFKYGASRWALPTGSTQLAATQQYGVFRDKLYPNPGSPGAQYLEMGARKITLCSFSSGILENSNSQVEVYKYFASNVGATANIYTTERGFEDEIVVAFGSQTTASGNKEVVSIKPGYDTAAITIPPAIPSSAVMPDDSVVVTFSDYNTQNLSVKVGITYSSSVISRTVTTDAVVNLAPNTFNSLYDSRARSGNVIITSTHNSGMVTSNTSFGERPVANVLAQNDILFSQNLWSTCLSEWAQLPGTSGDPSRIYCQENVYEEVFPVTINIQKYSPDGIYANKLGRAIIKNVKFSIGGTTIQDLDDLWYITNDELLRSEDEKDSLKFLINGGQDYLPTSDLNYGPVDLYIPLDLFFCRTRKTSSTLITPVKVFDEYRSWKPYLPLCAMGSQDFEIEIEFYPQQYFSNTGQTINLPDVKTSIITEEILISQNEKNYLKSQPQEFLIETATKFPQQVFSMTTPEIEQKFEGFIADYPLKMTNWLFRSKQFEDENDSTYFLQRYNFSTVVSTNDKYRLFFEFMKKAEFYIEGVPQIERFGTTDYYKYVNAITGGLSSTQKNIYSYLFSLDPTKYGPSGSLNFSETNSNKTFLSFKIDPQNQSSAIEKVDASLGATLHGWGYGFNVLKVENGRAFKPFS